MRVKNMKMGGAESLEHIQKPATAIQDHRYDSRLESDK